MYCKKCGSEINDDAVVCPNCGCATDNLKQKPSVSGDDAPSAGFAVLGFFFPLIGLILYLVWNDTLPLRAKSVGKGALIGVIVSVALGIISVIITVAGVACVASRYAFVAAECIL